MFKIKNETLALIASSLLSLSAPAWAQTDMTNQTNIWSSGQGLFREPAQESEARVLGWKTSATVGLNLSLSSSQDVIGQTDGTSQTYGLNLKSGANRHGERDEWRSDFL
ncbi:MAG: hypothetical protein HC902_07520 [Calothrix sp. SM1_5_4]|nr:hypothetical protein [Calothrix sp. SM1_5_4]